MCGCVCVCETDVITQQCSSREARLFSVAAVAMAMQKMDTDGSGAAEHLQLAELGHGGAPLVLDRGGAGEQLQLAELAYGGPPLVPIVEVAFPNDMWWSLSPELSDNVLRCHNAGLDAVYIWDWGPNGRTGSWRPEGKSTRLSRYRIDFQGMLQTNLDNGRERTIRIVYVRADNVKATRCGQQ